MKVKVIGSMFVALLLSGACAPTETGRESTTATSQDLLTAAGVVEAPTGSLPPGSPRVLMAPAEEAPQELDITLLGVDRGSKEAPVRVVEFSDYGCGYCRKFHLETWPTLEAEFITTGKVEWKFLPYVSGMFKNSPSVTLGAECVMEQGEDLFDEMNHRVWDRQQDWKGAADPEPVVRELAQESGADMARFDTCVSSGTRAWRVEGATALARELGVRATPTFFVVGYPPLQGALPLDVFQQVLGTVYEEATRAGGDR